MIQISRSRETLFLHLGIECTYIKTKIVNVTKTVFSTRSKPTYPTPVIRLFWQSRWPAAPATTHCENTCMTPATTNQPIFRQIHQKETDHKNGYVNRCMDNLIWHYLQRVVQAPKRQGHSVRPVHMDAVPDSPSSASTHSAAAANGAIGVAATLRDACELIRPILTRSSPEEDVFAGVLFR